MAEKDQVLQQQNLIQCETRRRLDPAAFVQNGNATVLIPRDTVLKRAHIYLEGSATATYAAGSPVASPYAIDKLLTRLDVIIDGQRTVKSITPSIMEKLNTLYCGIRPKRAYGLPGATLNTLIASTETPSGPAFVYPTTTEYLVWNEEFVLWFELPPWAMAYEAGRSSTLLNCKNVSSAEMRFNFGAIENVQQDGGAVSITYGGVDLKFIPTIVEAREVPSDQIFFDFKETMSRQSYTSEQREAQIQLPRGNKLLGVGVQVRNGDSARSLVDRGIRNMQLVINGQSVLQRSTFRENQIALKSRYGASDDSASGKHTLEGFAYINLLQSGYLGSSLNTSIGAGVDTVNLVIDSAPDASGIDDATYTNGLEVTVLAQELAATPVKI